MRSGSRKNDAGRTFSATHEVIGRFKKESEKHKLLNRRLRYFLFGLTGFATVLSAAALQHSTDDQVRWFLNFSVVLVSVGAGIVTSIEALRKPSQLWILERSVFHALEDLKRELEYEGSEATETKVDLYFYRMQRILAASNEQWTVQVNPPKQKPTE